MKFFRCDHCQKLKVYSRLLGIHGVKYKNAYLCKKCYCKTPANRTYGGTK